jgi:osmotically-inducible protein OsmY
MSFDRYRSESEDRWQEGSGRSGERGRDFDRYREDEGSQRRYSEGYDERFGRGFQGEGRMGSGRGERSERSGGFDREDRGRGRFSGGESYGRSYGEEFGQGANQVWNEPRYRGSRESQGGRREPWSGENFRGQESYGSYGADSRSMGSDRESGYGQQGGRYGSSFGSSMGSSSGAGSYGSSYGSSGSGSFGYGRGFEGGSGSESYRSSGSGAYGGFGTSSQRGRGRFSGKGPKGYQRSDDRIKEDVSDLLEREGELDASEIEVQVSSGEVTLTGTVSERSSKRLAEDLIEDLPGVKQVHNRLRVGNGSETGGSESSSGRSGSTRSGSAGSSSSKSSTSS